MQASRISGGRSTTLALCNCFGYFIVTIDVLTEKERVRRREHMRDVHSALKAGMSLEEFERAREQRVQRWIGLFHSEMEE
jgi:hypothetical protein